MTENNSHLPYGIIYGPVKSRRLGNSLGINLLPLTCKICSFDCIYCQYGWTTVHTIDKKVLEEIDFPPTDKIISEIETALHKIDNNKIDHISFSGYGEPTLHPEFNKIIKSTKELCNNHAIKTSNKKIPIVIISNSTNIEQTRVGLQEADVRVMKLDACIPEIFNKINRPVPGVKLENIINNLKTLNDIIIQTMFLEINSGEEAIEKWIDCIVKIKPIEIHIYSLDRLPADSNLICVEKSILENIAELTTKKTGIKTRTF